MIKNDKNVKKLGQMVALVHKITNALLILIVFDVIFF
jgi:hypothetical protein